MLLQEHRQPEAGSFDVAGFVLSGAGLALLLYALSRGADLGWGSPSILLPAAGGMAAGVALVFVELARREPLLHLRLFRDRIFRATNLSCLFGFGAFLGMLFVTSLFVQSGKGMSALDAGLATFPEAVGVLVGTQVVSRLYWRVGPRRLMAGGLTVLAAALVALSQLDFAVDLWVVQALLFVGGFGMAAVFLPLQAATFATISQAEMGRASALYNTQRQTAGAVGVAVVATVIQSQASGSLTASAGPFRAAFLAAAVLAVLGALAAAFLVHDVDAAATMTRPGAAPTPADADRLAVPD
jgi:predicted MFS family arabinose efflux permease